MTDSNDNSIETRIRRALPTSNTAAFSAGFEDRALARWRADRVAPEAPSVFSLIEHRARRLLPLAVAASLVLAVYSARSNRSDSAMSNIVERALGWKEAPTADLFETVYGLSAGSISTEAR